MKSFLKYYFNAILFNSLGYAVFLVLVWVLIFKKDLGPVPIIGSSIIFGIFISILIVWYNAKVMKENGIIDYSPSSLDKHLQFDKESKVTVEELIDKIKNVKYHNDYHIKRSPTGIVLKSKILRFADEIQIECEPLGEKKYKYQIEISQRNKKNIEKYVRNMKLLHWIKYYL